jgi:hypothetical protein
MPFHTRSTDIRAFYCLLLITACTVELELPSQPAPRVPLSIAPSLVLVAPFETVSFAASGGSDPYRFRLSDDAKDGESIGAETGLFIAGRRPGAEYQAVVEDADGETSAATIRVGAELSIVPARVAVAPSGRVVFGANGGKPPYTFRMVESPSGGNVDADAGAYSAGSVADVTDVVEVTDATGKAVARAEVGIGRALTVLAATSSRVPPRGTVNLIVLGGQPPYDASVAVDASGGATLDTATLTYTAGPVGDVTDEVLVRDANGEERRLAIAVGSALSARVDTEDLRSGVKTRVVASGGLPPYRFTFANRGNRSAGLIDEITGDYTPGPNVGAVDLIEIVDATGRNRASVVTAEVGPVKLGAGGAFRCLGGDVDADRVDEAIFIEVYDPCCNPYGQLGRVSVAYRNGVVQTYRLGEPVFDVVGVDLNADAHRDLVLAADTGVYALEAALDGRLMPARRLFSRPRGVPGREAFAPGIETVAGAAHPRFFVLDSSGVCGAGGGWARIDLAADGSIERTSCAVPAPQPLPTAAVSADFDGDGALDLAWVGSGGAEIVVRYGPDYLVESVVSMPTGFTYMPPQAAGSTYSLKVLRPPDMAAPTIVAGIRSGTGANHLWNVTLTGRMAIDQQVEIDPPGSVAIEGMATVPAVWGGTSMILAWNGSDGRLRGIPVSRGGQPGERFEIHRTSYAIDCAAAADMNGDQYPDLVTTSASLEWSDLVNGFGADGFGTRRSFVGFNSYAVVPAIRDFDGDGIDDIASFNGSTVTTYLGTDRQLALGPSRVVSPPPYGGAFVTEDLNGDGLNDIGYYADGHGPVWRPSLGGGRFGEAVDLVREDGRQDPRPFMMVAAAELGGNAPGPDMLGAYPHHAVPSRLPWAMIANVRSTGNVVTRVETPTVSAQRCWGVPADTNGDGLDDAVFTCRRWESLNQIEVLVSEASRASGALSFGAWRQVHAFTIDPGKTAAFLVLKPVRHAAFILAADFSRPSTRLVRVDSRGVVYKDVPVAPARAWVADLNSDAEPDFVLVPSAPWRAISVVGTATGFEPRPSGVSLSSAIVFSARLGGQAEDLLAFGVDRYVVYENDGTGHFWKRRNQSGAVLGFNPSRLEIGAAGGPATLSATLVNNGAAEASSLGIEVPDGVSITTTCGSSIAAGAQCSVTVTAVPPLASNTFLVAHADNSVAAELTLAPAP